MPFHRLRSCALRFCGLGFTLLLCSDIATAALDAAALTEVKGILRSRCAECHSAEASSTDFDILDTASLIKSEAVKPGDADGSLLMQVLVTDEEEIRMPQELPQVPADEIEKIRRWISDGAKPFPSDVKQPEVADKEDAFAGLVGVEYVLKQILAHQRMQNSHDQQYMRYFSCNHLLTRGATPRRTGPAL